MPRKAESTLDVLARHEEQQRLAGEKLELLRRAAALDLGLIVLDAGGSALGVDGVQRAIETALRAEVVTSKDLFPEAGDRP